jgi:hypothetical protein
VELLRGLGKRILVQWFLYIGKKSGIYNFGEMKYRLRGRPKLITYSRKRNFLPFYLKRKFSNPKQVYYFCMVNTSK